MSKKILVTGGAGFLGSNLCEKLINLGHEVIALDNLYTGRIENLKSLLSPLILSDFRSGAKKIVSKDKFHFLNHDIENSINLKVDWIFNLACPASPPHYQKNPIKTTTTSVIGSLNMLELAKKNNAKIFQASTSEVYGDPDIHPQVENYRGNVNPIGIRACYDEGKRCAETIFFDYNRMFDTQIKVVRIFNTYGPNMDSDDGRVVSNFIVQALQNKSLTMYGDGTQTRSFCYVDDLIDGFIAMMNSGENIKGPINLGNPDEFSLLELADLVLKLTGSKSKIVFQNLPSDDPTRRKPDITLAKKLLNWEPKIKLEQGLIKTIEYFKFFLKEKNENNSFSRRQV